MAHHQRPVLAFDAVITIAAQSLCGSDPDTGQEGTETELGPHASPGPMTAELPAQLGCRVAEGMGPTS